MVELVALEEVVGGGALAADAFLFFGEDVVADPVGVVRGEELPFLVVEPVDFGSGAVGFLLGDLRRARGGALDGGADGVALLVGELDGGVVVLRRRLRRLRRGGGAGCRCGRCGRRR